MSRQRRALRGPRGVDIGKVPIADRSDTTLFRAVAADRPQPWWLSNRARSGRGAGRFDLGGSRGTCYLSSTPVGAILERVGDPQADEQPLVSTRTLEAMAVWHGNVPSADKLADVPSVPQLTGEISTVEDYTLTWEWADAFDRAGHRGVLYRGRFAQAECVALFGEAGAGDAGTQPARLDRTPAVAYELELPPAWRAAVTRPPTAAESPQAPAP